MNYIERIRNNVINAIQINTLAITKNVNYNVAKIMYHDGKRDIDIEEARTIFKKLKEEDIPINLMDDLEIIDIYQSYNDIKLIYVYQKISQYANRKYLYDLDSYIWSCHNYGKLVYELMKKGASLESAINNVENMIEDEIKNNQLSELAAVAKVLFFRNNNAALAFENQYLNKKAIKYDSCSTVKNGLIECGKYWGERIYGITLLSETAEGLKKLEKTVKNAFQNGDYTFFKELSREASSHNLFVIDFSIIENNMEKILYDPRYKYIYLKEEYGVNMVTAFSHEATHFLDNVRGDKYEFFSINNPVIRNILKKIKDNKLVIPRGISLRYFMRLNMLKYVNNAQLNRKWLSEIKSKHINASENEIQYFMCQKKLYERKKYEILLGNMTDIYDGLSRGFLYDFGVPGHGKEYYSDDEAIYMEFIAQIGTFYNLGCTDIIYHEFGKKLAEEIIGMYEEFIKKGNLENDYNQKRNGR